MTGINVLAQSDIEKDSNGNSDNVVDNGNAGEGASKGDTQAGSVSSHHNDENNANTEEEETQQQTPIPNRIPKQRLIQVQVQFRIVTHNN